VIWASREFGPCSLPAAHLVLPSGINAGLTITPEAVSEVREGDPNRLRKRLQGDLDSILLTALRKEPARRYSSVEAFSGDLRRHLDNLPVERS